MQEIRQILLERVAHIFELQAMIINQGRDKPSRDHKYAVLMEQKRAEKIRSIRESDLLTSLNATTLEMREKIEEVPIK